MDSATQPTKTDRIGWHNFTPEKHLLENLSVVEDSFHEVNLDRAQRLRHEIRNLKQYRTNRGTVFEPHKRTIKQYRPDEIKFFVDYLQRQVVVHIG